MKCPVCGFEESKVIDSRPANDGSSIRRRRECLECQKRFTTYENIETAPLIIVKRDKSREKFDRNKVLTSIMSACDKRQISRTDMERIVNDIEQQLQNSLQNEIPSSYVGELVMAALKKIDEVAYIRFASVYRKFKDINDFINELQKLQSEK